MGFEFLNTECTECFFQFDSFRIASLRLFIQSFLVGSESAFGVGFECLFAAFTADEIGFSGMGDGNGAETASDLSLIHI